MTQVAAYAARSAAHSLAPFYIERRAPGRGYRQRCCRTIATFRIRLPERETAATPERAAARAQASPDA